MNFSSLDFPEQTHGVITVRSKPRNIETSISIIVKIVSTRITYRRGRLSAWRMKKKKTKKKTLKFFAALILKSDPRRVNYYLVCVSVIRDLYFFSRMVGKFGDEMAKIEQTPSFLWWRFHCNDRRCCFFLRWWD